MENEKDKVMEYGVSFFFNRKTKGFSDIDFSDISFIMKSVSMTYLPDKTLKIFLSNEKQGNAWEVFYNNATFKEILTSADNPHLNAEKLFPPTYPKPPLPPFDTFEAWEKAYLKYAKQMLTVIRDYPFALHSFDEAVQPLAYILKIARYSINREKAKEARNLLRDYLLPSYTKHKITALPSNKRLRLIRELLIHLAKHLSDKCKQSLSDWQDSYDDILAWSHENDGRIYEIANKSKSLVMRLLSKPSDFVNSTMCTYYRISLRTLKAQLHL